jgi:lipopolysaccharide export system protein LptC
MAARSSPSSLSAIRRVRLGSETDQADAFALAERHSRRVRVLKVALPALAAALALGFAVFSYVRSPIEVAVNTTDSVFVDGKLVMAKPQLEGVTKDNRPYEMLAERAIQEATAPGIIQLEAISAKLPLYDKEWVTIDAPGGTYDRDKNTLDMQNPFRIKTTNGLSATINSAFIDMGNSTLKTSDPVDIVLNGTRLTAESMSVLEKGKLFVFDKKVRLVIDPTRLKEMRSASGAVEGVIDANGG